jgi:hypothetical protein
MRHLKASLAAIATAVIVGGCTTAATAPSSAASATAAPPVESASPSAASRPDGPGFDGRDAVVVVGRPSDANLTAIIASTGDQLVQLPVGVPASPSWAYLGTTTVTGGRTIVAAVGIADGSGSNATLDGAWALPTVGYDPTPTGLSADGKTLVLVPAGDPDPARTTSRFAIVPFPPIDGAPELAPRVVELQGALDYDAISPDGRILYVAEHLGGNGGYQVRAVDLPGGTVRPDPIVDKRNIGEAMAGWPVSQLRSPSGLVLTLYRGTDHPFIHALQTAEAWAVCIDLPAGGDATSDGDWGLAASTDGRSVYAVNATRGVAVDVDRAELIARRTVMLETASLPTFDLAKFGHVDGGPVGRRVVASPDGSAVFAAGTDGVLRLKPDLSVDTTLVAGSTVSSIGLLPDGRTLYALLADGGRVVAVDAATGARIGEVPGGGYDRLVAVVPWR